VDVITKKVCLHFYTNDINAKCEEETRLFFPEDNEDNANVRLKQSQQNVQENPPTLLQHMHAMLANVWLGSNIHGLLEDLPHDMMHAFLNGVLIYIIEVTMYPCKPIEKLKLLTRSLC